MRTRNRLISIILVAALVVMVLAPVMPASAQSGTTAWVNTGRLNLRAGPGVSYGIVTSLLRNTPVTMMGRTSDASWIQVTVQPGNLQGWMRSSLLRPSTPIGNLPVTWVTTTPPPPPPTGTYYTVQSGENLFRVGLRFGLQWTVIAAANNIVNPNLVFAGQTLFIPAGGTVPPTGGPLTHVVQPGETLQIIAARYGTTWQALAALNNLPNPNFVYAGQRLVISGPSTPQPRTYTVQRGDNLTAIAARFGTTVQAIMAANNIANANYINPGQVLTIP